MYVRIGITSTSYFYKIEFVYMDLRKYLIM